MEVMIVEEPQVGPNRCIHIEARYALRLDFVRKQVPFLLLHPLLVVELSLSLPSLHLEILIQTIQPLLLQIYLGFHSGVTDLLVLLHLELVQVGMLGQRAQHLDRVILLRCEIDHSLLLGLKVLAPVHVLAELIRALKVVKLTIPTRICQDIEVIWVFYLLLRHMKIEGRRLL